MCFIHSAIIPIFGRNGRSGLQGGKVGRKRKPETKHCKVCGRIWVAELWWEKDNETCSRGCGVALAWERRVGFGGWTKRKTRLSTVQPSSIDIAWAAGVYEGEGSTSRAKTSCKVSVTQKDSWILWKFLRLFGGSVKRRKDRSDSDWTINGVMARGFLMTIYVFLSPWRKTQARYALGLTDERNWREYKQLVEAGNTDSLAP